MQMIKNIPSDFVDRWNTGLMELTPIESFMRFVITHDVEFMRDQSSLGYIAILTPKK